MDEVKNIHDVATAMKAYAKQAQDKQLEIDASEIRIRAERRLGEMIRQQKETVGLNEGRAGTGRPPLGGSEKEPPKDTRPTLAEVGISKKLSSRSQAIAAIPQEEFEEALDEHREKRGKINEITEGQTAEASPSLRRHRRGGPAQTKRHFPFPFPYRQPSPRGELHSGGRTTFQKGFGRES